MRTVEKNGRVITVTSTGGRHKRSFVGGTDGYVYVMSNRQGMKKAQHNGCFLRWYPNRENAIEILLNDLIALYAN